MAGDIFSFGNGDKCCFKYERMISDSVHYR